MVLSTPAQLTLRVRQALAICTRSKAATVLSYGTISFKHLLPAHCSPMVSSTSALPLVHLMALYTRCAQVTAPCSRIIPLPDPCLLHQSWMVIQSTLVQAMAWPMHYGPVMAE